MATSLISDTQKTKIQEIIDDIHETFARTITIFEEGERVLKDLMEAYYHRISFSRDPYATAFNEGQRAVLVRILNLLKEDKDNG